MRRNVLVEMREGGGGRLLFERCSALPAGSEARLLLTYIRLVEGGRLKARRGKRAKEAGSNAWKQGDGGVAWLLTG